MIKYLIAILLTTTAAYSQTIKTLGYNTTNGQVAYSGSNTLTFTNPLGFGNAATTRTNLGLGWSVLTNTDASNFRSAIGLSLAALTNTNVTNFRTDIGLGSLATNNSVPSGTNISNSILVSDGSGSSIFSTNIFPASLTITNTNGTTIIRASTNLGVRINGFTAYISGNESVPFVGTGTLGYAEGGAGNSGALVFANGNGGSLFTRWGLDGGNYLGMRGTANHFSLQGIRLYGKFTNSTNYSRIVFASDSNGMSFIRPEAAGPSATNNVLNISGLPETNQGSTNILWNDFGLIKATNVTGVPSGAAASNSLLTADGAGGSAFVSTLPRLTLDRLQFGGTNTNFPALKRTNTVLQVRLADDSAYTTIDAQHRLQGTAPTNSTAAGTAGDIRYDTNDFLYICVSSNTWRRIALTNW